MKPKAVTVPFALASSIPSEALQVWILVRAHEKGQEGCALTVDQIVKACDALMSERSFRRGWAWLVEHRYGASSQRRGGRAAVRRTHDQPVPVVEDSR